MTINLVVEVMAPERTLAASKDCVRDPGRTVLVHPHYGGRELCQTQRCRIQADTAYISPPVKLAEDASTDAAERGAVRAEVVSTSVGNCTKRECGF